MAQPGAAASDRTKYQQIYRTLHERLQRGEFRPGDRLQVRTIATEFGTSDIPVREALSRLSAEGLVDYRPHQGGMVINLRAEELRDLMVLKAVLEGTATRLAAPHVTPLLLEQLEALALQGDAVQAEVDAYAEINRRFHAAIYDVCPVREVVAAVRTAQVKLDTQRKATIFVFFPDRTAASCREHHLLIRALRRLPQDLDHIESLVRWHKLQNVLRLPVEGSSRLCGGLVSFQPPVDDPLPRREELRGS